MTVCISIPLWSEWVTIRCLVRRVLPSYRGMSRELLLAAPLLIHWCVYESYCSFFPPKLKSIPLGYCVCEKAHVYLCRCVCIYICMVVHVNVCVCVLVSGISWGQNNTFTKIQTQQPCRTQRKIIPPQVFFKVLKARWERVCLYARVSVCMFVCAFISLVQYHYAQYT